MSSVATTPPMTGHIHIVGIGGAGMSGIARILAARGVTVSGSDARESRRLVALRALGHRRPRRARAAERRRAPTPWSISTAIKADNPEVVAAGRAGHPGRVARRRPGRGDGGLRAGVAVAGTHGKTTTTSMLTIALQQCDADPSYAIGSELNESGANAHQGSGDLFIVEADESDGSFLALPAIAGIVTNVEPDHLDHWGTTEAVEAAFAEFAAGIGARGRLRRGLRRRPGCAAPGGIAAGRPGWTCAPTAQTRGRLRDQ